ncbi:MAG TPA: carboxypeptidase-like regulatory domain-containing protein, partial [Solirubrobacteraceae bacterium]|nr:carboxypeptidase-like regulatory domain-containing protein [Solirubrobacteraceae bacterium]
WKGSRRERIVVGYGHAETIVGQLTAPGGGPISGAQVEVLATPAYTGAKPAKMASPMTGSDGRFVVRLPAGASSRTLRFVYRSHQGDALPSVTRTLTLAVRAGIALTLTPRTASVGRSVRFRGRLRGGPIPRGGKQLVLEARSPGGRWIKFDVIRTDSHGRYHASYRFKFPGPADYQFRVRSEPESDYPFAAGASKAIRVRER